MKNKIALVSTGFIGSVVSGEYAEESIRVYEAQKEMIDIAREYMYDKPTKKTNKSGSHSCKNRREDLQKSTLYLRIRIEIQKMLW